MKPINLFFHYSIYITLLFFMLGIGLIVGENNAPKGPGVFIIKIDRWEDVGFTDELLHTTLGATDDAAQIQGSGFQIRILRKK